MVSFGVNEQEAIHHIARFEMEIGFNQDKGEGEDNRTGREAGGQTP